MFKAWYFRANYFGAAYIGGGEAAPTVVRRRERWIANTKHTIGLS
jgi:hypothetical protein